MPSARFQPSFGGGVLGPGLHGRIDLGKYDVGLKTGYNVFVHAHGGVSNRPGTEFIGEVMDHSVRHRLIPFMRDEDDNYVLVFGDEEMKIIYDGAFVQDGGSDYSTTTPFASTALRKLDYAQSIDVMYFASRSYYPRKMSRTGATTWTFSNVEQNPDVDAPTGVNVTYKDNGSITYKYKVSSIDGTGVEGFPSTAGSNSGCADLSALGQRITVTWTASSDASYYHVYRQRGGVYGYVGFTDDLEFIDDNISSNLEITPVSSSNIWAASGRYPGAVAIFQQRVWWANSTNFPERMWASRTGEYENYTKSRVVKDTDRLQFDLTGPSINRVQFMVPMRELLAFTSSGEYTVTGPDNIVTATNPIVTQYGYNGSADVKPLVIVDSTLFVDRTGRTVRDLRYAFEEDGYSGNDLTVFAHHFFENKDIAGWCYAQKPYSIVWAYLSDGTLLSLTYKREHQVWAWCEHDVSGGAVESICAIPEGNEDAVYMIVRRTIDGATVRYIERLHTRDFESDAPEDAFFVDCGITYSGTATTTITGLDHLEGETLVALADGNVVTDLTVASGQVTLPDAASLVHVGLGYEAEIETLPPAIELRDEGSARGRPHKISRMRVQVEKTRGIQAGPSNERLVEHFQTSGDLAESIGLETGMIDMRIKEEWNKDGTIIIKQPYPLPMTILGISPEYSIGR